MAIWTSAPISAAMTAARCAGLDDVVEHVLAVARAVLEPAEELDDLRREAGDAGVVGGLLAGLAHGEVDLGLGLGDDLLDAAGMDAAVGDELRDRDPRDLAADRVEPAEDDRLGRVVDDQVDAGRLFEGADVAALTADDPALHLVARQVDDADRVLGRVVRGHALHRGQDDVAGLVLGFVARGALDRPGDLDGIVLRLRPDRLDEHALGVVGAHAGDALEGVDLLLVRAGEVLLGLVELALAVDQLAIALLEDLGALVQLLVAGGQAPFLGGQLVASRPGLVLGLALEAELLVLGLEDELLLAGSSLGLDSAGFGLGGLHRLRCPQAADGDAEYGSAGRGHDGHSHDHDRIHRCPPARTGSCGRTCQVSDGVVPTRTVSRPRFGSVPTPPNPFGGGAPRWAEPAGSALPSALSRRPRYLPRSLGPRPGGVNQGLQMGAAGPHGIIGPSGPPRSVDGCRTAIADPSKPSIIGAGQAGLMMSWHLRRAGREHVVLERRETLGGGWQDRWDGFRLVSPNWISGFPGFPYDGDDPDAFMPRDAIVERVASLRRGHRRSGRDRDGRDSLTAATPTTVPGWSSLPP